MHVSNSFIRAHAGLVSFESCADMGLHEMELNVEKEVYPAELHDK